MGSNKRGSTVFSQQAAPALSDPQTHRAPAFKAIVPEDAFEFAAGLRTFSEDKQFPSQIACDTDGIDQLQWDIDFKFPIGRYRILFLEIPGYGSDQHDPRFPTEIAKRLALKAKTELERTGVQVDSSLRSALESTMRAISVDA